MNKLLALLFTALYSLAAYESNFGACLDVEDSLFKEISRIENRLGHSANFKELREAGISDFNLDQIALKWCNALDDFRMICIWPQVPLADADFLAEWIEEYGKCFYHKQLSLYGEGPIKLLYLIPDKRPRFKVVLPKFFPKGRDRYEMMCFLARFKNIRDGCKLKGAVRAHYKIGQYSIHVSDTHEQSMDLAKLFLSNQKLAEFCATPFSY